MRQQRLRGPPQFLRAPRGLRLKILRAPPMFLHPGALQTHPPHQSRDEPFGLPLPLLAHEQIGGRPPPLRLPYERERAVRRQTPPAGATPLQQTERLRGLHLERRSVHRALRVQPRDAPLFARLIQSELRAPRPMPAFLSVRLRPPQSLVRPIADVPRCGSSRPPSGRAPSRFHGRRRKHCGAPHQHCAQPQRGLQNAIRAFQDHGALP